MRRHGLYAEPKGEAGSSAADLEAEIGGLVRLPRPTLVELWRALHRSDPPRGISRRVLIGAIAYEIQARRFGHLKPAAGRRLEMIAEGRSPGPAAKVNVSPKLGPGARLVREWNGATHTVDVVAGGYVWKGARYRSLSAIARTITGTRWSGPRFFGITSEDAS